MTAALMPAGSGRAPANEDGSIWVGGSDVDAARADIEAFVETLLAARPWLVIWFVVCLAISVAIIRSTPAEYVATTRILLEPRWLGPAAAERMGPARRIALDDVQSRTQLAMMRSPATLRRVFYALDIAGTPDAAADSDGLWTRLTRFIRDRYSADRDFAQRHRAFDRFLDRLLVRRLSNSYVFEFAYRSLSPERAVHVADAAASAYSLSRIEGAVAQAQAGAFALTGNVADVLRETAIASDAVAAGRPVTADLPDAGVRPLGPATIPLVAVSPRLGLILAVTACLSAVSGLLAVMVASRMRHPLRSRRQLRLRFGLDCLCIRVADEVDGRFDRSTGFMPLDRALPILRATLAAEDLLTGRKAIGIATWAQGAWCGLIAGKLHDLLAASGVLVAPAEVAAECHGSVPRQQGIAKTDGVRLAALMPLRHRPHGAVAPDLDGVILIIEAGRSTIRQVHAAIEAVRSRNVILSAVLLIEGTLPNPAAKR